MKDGVHKLNFSTSVFSACNKMKKKIFYLILSISVIMVIYLAYGAVAEWSREKNKKEWVKTLTHSASNNVQILVDTISIDYLGEKRTLAIYLPESYQTDTLEYPVIYFLDGQSLFDQKIQEGTEWQLDEVLDSISSVGGNEAIVVGIYNSEDRNQEYKPFTTLGWFRNKTYSGDKHAAWIVNKLKPWIDENFRSKRDINSTLIGGASLGGLMSYYMLMSYPEVFGGAFVFSPSFWINEKIFELHKDNELLFSKKIYFNVGEKEPITIEKTQKMHQKLLDYGMPAANMKLDIEKGLGHSHSTWRNGFRKAYPWISKNK